MLRNQRRLADGEFAAAEAACKDLASRAKRMGLGYWRIFLDAQRSTITLARHGVEAARQWNLNALVSDASDIELSYRASFVALSAELGREREAQRMLDHMAARRFEDLPKDIGYLNALSNLANAAVHLRDRPRAERLYELLLPYALLNTPNSLSFYDGSASTSLARLAALFGWEDRAEDHFLVALAMNDRMGARPALARVAYEYARWLAERQRPARARGEAQRAVKLAGELGMGWLEARAMELAD